MQAPTQGCWIQDAPGLARLCEHVAASALVAVDTEFATEKRYYARFDLLQVGTPSLVAAVDVHARVDLAPLVELLADPSRTTVLHAGAHDVELLLRRTGKAPATIFDTQIAAALAGLGPSVGFGALVEQLTGTVLAKAETLIDWSQRPLRPEQLEYALDDVRWLFPLHEALVARLTALGRVEWLAEETRRAYAPERFLEVDPAESWRGVRAVQGLPPRQLAIAREVCAWRESAARKRDVPPRFLLQDDVIVAIARRAPSRVGELREIRMIHPQTLTSCGDAIVNAVRRGTSLTDEAAAALAALPEPEPIAPGITTLLDAFVRARAEELSIAPHLLCPAADLPQLVRDLRAGRESSVSLLSGWRRDLIGLDAVRLAKGEVALRIEPATGKVVLEEVRRP